MWINSLPKTQFMWTVSLTTGMALDHIKCPFLVSGYIIQKLWYHSLICSWSLAEQGLAQIQVLQSCFSVCTDLFIKFQWNFLFFTRNQLGDLIQHYLKKKKKIPDRFLSFTTSNFNTYKNGRKLTQNKRGSHNFCIKIISQKVPQEFSKAVRIFPPIHHNYCV